MKKKNQRQIPADHAAGDEIDHEIEKETAFKEGVDICQQLMDRYSKSSAPQHRHLLATAVAMRSILSDEDISPSPSSYFTAAISALDDSKSLDAMAIGALLTFLSIVVPMVPPEGIESTKAKEAVVVLVGILKRKELGVAMRNAVKCLGSLLLGFCDLDDWSSVKLGVETLLTFSMDKHPKVRKCAHECVENVFKSFSHSDVVKEASKLVYSYLKRHMPVAVSLSSAHTPHDPKDEKSLRSKELKILQILNVLKVTVPFLPVNVGSKVFSDLCKLISSEFSPLTRHIFKTVEVFFEISKFDAVIIEEEKIAACLASYLSNGKKNPADTLLSAANLLKSLLDKLHAVESSSRKKNVSLVLNSVADLLNSEVSTAAQASVIIKDLINLYIDPPTSLTDESHSFEDDFHASEEASTIKSLCSAFENILCSSNEIPNEHVLEAISALFQKLGQSSCIFMKGILLKLADLVTLACKDSSDKSQLQNCIGSAIIAMGPEKILKLLPISLNSSDQLCLNNWLIPLLKDYVVGASLEYYMENIVPLAKSFEEASHKVKKSEMGEDMQAHARSLWGLLPAFCRYSTDTHKKFGHLVELLINLLRDDSSMHEGIAVALQILVNQNKNVLGCQEDAQESKNCDLKESALHLSRMPYSTKTASRNIKSMSSQSARLLRALTDEYIDAYPTRHSFIKDAIGCLASITDSSITKKIFMSILEKFQLTSEGELEMQEVKSNESADEEQDKTTYKEKYLKRSVIIDLASSFVEGAKEDLVHIIYDLIKHTIQENNEIGHHEAYVTLSRILEKHSWFCDSKSEELIDLLLSIKPPPYVATIRRRFECLHVLMVHALKISSDEESSKAFLVLNEIILMMKDGDEEQRKAAYDVLLKMSSTLKNSSEFSSDTLSHKLISMIMGYLSDSSPHITSGAVSALSVLVHNDPEISLQVPDLISSLLSLLQTKSVEVIKAVLGFVKVLVSSLEANDLHALLSEVIEGILPWSFVSRNHFREKVTVILEIMIRKCGSAAVRMVAPEKYKNFMKTVLENRHGKTSYNDAGAEDKEATNLNSATEGMQKRKRKESGLLSRGEGPREDGKRNWEKKDNFSRSDSKPGKRPRRFEKPVEGQSDGRKTTNKRKFNEGSSNEKRRKIEHSNKGEDGTGKHKQRGPRRR